MSDSKSVPVSVIVRTVIRDLCEMSARTWHRWMMNPPDNVDDDTVLTVALYIMRDVSIALALKPLSQRNSDEVTEFTHMLSAACATIARTFYDTAEPGLPEVWVKALGDIDLTLGGE